MVTTSNQTPLQGCGSQTSGFMVTTSNQTPLQGSGSQTSGVMITTSNQIPLQGNGNQTVVLQEQIPIKLLLQAAKLKLVVLW